MEINETIRVMEFFLHKQCSLGRMKFTPYDDDNLIWHVVNDVFEEWKWYREQDLIRREDVKNDEVLKEIALGFEREFLKTVMMIPKAEYEGEQ